MQHWCFCLYNSLSKQRLHLYPSPEKINKNTVYPSIQKLFYELHLWNPGDVYVWNISQEIFSINPLCLGIDAHRKWGQLNLWFACFSFPPSFRRNNEISTSNLTLHLLQQDFPTSALLTFWAGQLCVVGLSCALQMVSRVPGFHLLDANSLPNTTAPLYWDRQATPWTLLAGSQDLLNCP